MEPCTIANKFRSGWKIADTSFGEIYHGTEIATGEEVAIKLEYAETKNPQLLRKSQIYTLLQGGTGIPKMRWYGLEGYNNVLVMDMLGHSLKDLFEYCGRKFSLKTVLMLADQMISCVEFVHSKSYLHCNIKPDNFHMGLHSQDQVSLIGFGLQSKMYKDPSTDQHIPYRNNIKYFTGSTSYASLQTHLGTEQSRKDDMESLGYMFMYFLRGSLPWKGLMPRLKEGKFQRKNDYKLMTSIDALCVGYPREFETYIHRCRSLPFKDSPDYAYLRRMFRQLYIQQGFQFDNKFDWHALGNRLSKMSALERKQLANAKDSQSETGQPESKEFSAISGSSLPPLPEKYKYQQGIEYIREASKSPFVVMQIHEYKNGQESKPAPYNVPEKHEYEKQGTEYIRPAVPSPSVRAQTHEHGIQQGTQYIRETTKSPFAAMQTHQYENHQDIEHIREKTNSPFVQMKTQRDEDDQGMEHIQRAPRSPHQGPKSNEYKIPRFGEW